ncbi:metalloreductase [Coprinopsis cinerea AmutBmut pab1-1]|nr:metalloreductase [Coprinopsis cinerea AmutBmut pab1-1]
MSFGKPPSVPDEFKTPQLALIDHGWQETFTIVWTSVLAFAVVVSVPRFVRAIKTGRAFKGVFGISESWGQTRYQALSAGVREEQRRVDGAGKSVSARKLEAVLNRVASVLWWSLPGLEVNAGQVILIVGYLVTVVVCIVTDATLSKNSNRPGYIALAQLPVVFLFATKNSVLSLILGPGHGYEKLNYIHKWAGRSIFLCSLIHGVLWILNHKRIGNPITGESKEDTGLAAFGVLCIMVISSLRPLRRWYYELFNVIHILAFVSFFVALCYHSANYLSPWIYPPLAFYGLDLMLRMFRTRIKDALLSPVNSQMTLVHIPDCSDGWVAGQHVRLRVFSSGRVFESHPFSIFTAPPGLSCVTSLPAGINLGARVMGDWTKALNDYARETAKVMEEQDECGKKEKPAVTPESSNDAKENAPSLQVPVQVMIDGPYGGCSVDLGRYETVLLFAGGAGATFTIGLLDDIVGRCVKLRRRGGEITKRIEFAWCVRSFGSIDWFAPALMDIAKVAESSDLAVHISIYVTCLCNPEAVPPIPNCDVTVVRPTIYNVLTDLVTPPNSTSNARSDNTRVKATEIKVEGLVVPDVKKRPSTAATATTGVSENSDLDESVEFEPAVRHRLPWVGLGGGVAVCASGPEGLTREAANAVARLQIHREGRELGPVGVHTEVFGL